MSKYRYIQPSDSDDIPEFEYIKVSDNKKKLKLKSTCSYDAEVKKYIPDKKELIYERDTKKFKIGDGKTRYNDLPYIYIKEENNND